MKSQKVLETAIKVLFMREEQYGSPEKNLGAIAEYWSIRCGNDVGIDENCSKKERPHL